VTVSPVAVAGNVEVTPVTDKLVNVKCYDDESARLPSLCNYVSTGGITYTLKATPNTGWAFDHWDLEGYASSTKDTVSCSVPTTGEWTVKTFKAVFSQAQPKPPVADAGPDQDVIAGALVTLDGSGSSDSDGKINSYRWEQTGGIDISLSSNTAQKPTFTAPTPPTGGTATLTFQLRVYDDIMLSDTDTVTVRVGPSNEPPVADAGPDQTVAEGGTVTLNGSGSSDPEGGSLTYLWAWKSGSAVTLTNPAAVNPTFVAPAPSEEPIVFELTVTDAGQLTAKDTVSITVGDTPAASSAWKIYYPHIVSGLSARTPVNGEDEKFWETEIVLINTGTEPVSGAFRAYDGAGEEVSTAVPVEDFVGRLSFRVGEAFENPDQIRYIVFELESGGSVVGYESLAVNGVCRTTFEAYTVPGAAGEEGGGDFNPPIVQSRACCAVPAASGAFMSLAQGEWTGLVFLNPGAGEVTVDLVAYNDAGQPVAATTIDMGSDEHRSGFALGFFPEGTDLSGASYLTYSASGEIIAVQFTGSYDGSMLDSLPGV